MSTQAARAGVRTPPPVVLSLDLGSSGLKGAAFDLSGRALSGLEAHAPLTLHYAAGGVAEVQLGALIVGIEDILDRLHQRLGARPVLGVALTSFVSSLVALRGGVSVGPVLTYADTRAASEVEAVAALVDKGAVGCPPFSAYWPAQIRWWRGQYAHLAPEQFCGVPDYLLLRWTSQLVSSYSLASWTGMLDRYTLGWNEGALQAAGVSREQLPALADYDHSLTLNREFAARWPKLSGVPFFLGVSDGATATVGSGAMQPGRLALTVGSTSAVRQAIVGSPPAVPTGLWSYRIDAQTHLLGGALTEGGNLFSWLSDTLKLSPRTLEEELLSIAPDSHGLTFIPSLGGTRSPDYDAHARGTLHGLSYATTPAQMARAGMEGVACRLSDLAALLSVPDDAVFIASGKALLASRPWQQMMSDALGRPLLLEDNPTGASARGAALLALQALGHAVSFEPTAQRLVEPVPEHTAIYAAASKRMGKLRDCLRELRPPEVNP